MKKPLSVVAAVFQFSILIACEPFIETDNFCLCVRNTTQYQHFETKGTNPTSYPKLRNSNQELLIYWSRWMHTWTHRHTDTHVCTAAGHTRQITRFTTGIGPVVNNNNVMIYVCSGMKIRPNIIVTQQHYSLLNTIKGVKGQINSVCPSTANKMLEAPPYSQSGGKSHFSHVVSGHKLVGVKVPKGQSWFYSYFTYMENVAQSVFAHVMMVYGAIRI